MTEPLGSLRVLDFSTLLPGPFASMFLADLGADVLRVENPHRPDMVRSIPPFKAGISANHALLNRSKRSLALDLKRPEAVDVIKRLIAKYDIVLEAFRPGVMDRLGLGYADLSAANPQLIYCALSGYGQSGPASQRAGHDLNFMGLSGITSHTGRRDGTAVPFGVQVADVGGGSYNALVGILAAEVHRRCTGEGQRIDISIHDGTLAWNAIAVAHFFATDQEPQKEGMLLNGGTYYDYYTTKDGRSLSVAGLEEKFWTGFCHAIGRADLVELGTSRDAATQSKLKLEIQKTLASRTLDEWLQVFRKADVCVEPVLTVSEALEHPQTQARGMIVDVPGKNDSWHKQIANPIRFSKTTCVYKHVGANLGEHTQEVLREIGYGEAEIESLKQARVTG